MRDSLKPYASRFVFLSVFAMILGVALAIIGLAGGPPYLALGFSGVVFAAGIGWAYAARVSCGRVR